MLVKDETGNCSFKVISNKWLQKEDQSKNDDLKELLQAATKSVF